MARSWACVSQALTKMVERFATYQPFIQPVLCSCFHSTSSRHNELPHALPFGGRIMKKFNEIKSRNDLADYLKIPHHVLTNVLYNRGVDTFYSVFEIP